MALIANADIVRVRRTPGGEDEYGDPIPPTETRVSQPDWAVAPQTSTDVDDQGRNGIVIGLLLLAPYDADLDPATDAVEVNGDLYEIEGDVGRHKSPFTAWEAGATTALRRAQG